MVLCGRRSSTDVALGMSLEDLAVRCHNGVLVFTEHVRSQPLQRARATDRCLTSRSTAGKLSALFAAMNWHFRGARGSAGVYTSFFSTSTEYSSKALPASGAQGPLRRKREAVWQKPRGTGVRKKKTRKTLGQLLHCTFWRYRIVHSSLCLAVKLSRNLT
ncbi:hypothetical protein DPEC_G00082710 [Dallia pectoralis]|uniref:Uncharacterized protein n=1 Tax=Dallia pectoralis TaxID=75939 RepID=A0ACC2GYN4_DALPE|nr:hypothetical protein DPEC_G00082710 [Dallia pectoralis]